MERPWIRLRLKLPCDATVGFLPGTIFDLGSVHYRAYDIIVALEVIKHVAHPDEFLPKPLVWYGQAV